MFRTLRADEIELRVGSVSGKGFSLLLYKDARCDMNILDETVGAMRWKRSHSRDNANCIVSIYNSEIGEWVSKEDAGTESFTEKEKGIASDSFKRACVNWGIGRELYTSPFIWIKDHVAQKDGKWKTDGYDRELRVKVIEYDDKRCVSNLVICDKNNKVVYKFGQKEVFFEPEEPKASEPEETISEKDRPKYVARISETMAKKGLDPVAVYKKIGVENIAEIETSRLPGMLTWLEEMKGA